MTNKTVWRHRPWVALLVAGSLWQGAAAAQEVREDSTIVPTRVYDNQQFTYIHLPPMANFPAVFGRHERNGEEFLVNTKSEKDVMVVLGVYPFLVMRLGNDVVGLRRNK